MQLGQNDPAKSYMLTIYWKDVYTLVHFSFFLVLLPFLLSGDHLTNESYLFKLPSSPWRPVNISYSNFKDLASPPEHTYARSLGPPCVPGAYFCFFRDQASCGLVCAPQVVATLITAVTKASPHRHIGSLS